MRNLVFGICVVGCIALCARTVFADKIILPQEQRVLLAKLMECEAGVEIREKEVDVAISALDSKFDDIRIQAIRVLLGHRLVGTWRAERHRLDDALGTSKKLALIVDRLFAEKAELNKPIIQVFPQDVLDMLPLKSDALRPSGKGDVPLEDVLLDLTVIDTTKRDRTENKTIAKSLLARYRLTPSQERLLIGEKIEAGEEIERRNNGESKDDGGQ